MMQARKSVLALTSLLTIFLASCGGHSTPPPQAPDYSSLDGNWRLFGVSSFPALPSQGDYIGLAVAVNGATVYARGNAFAVCQQGTAAIGGSISASSPIASDGSFVLTNSTTPLSTLQYTITGTVPPKGSSTWQGSYTLSNSSSSTLCTFNQTGTFSATAYAPFHGTYAGPFNGTGLGSGVSIVLQVSQGAPTFTYVGLQSLPVMYIPLTGTVTVSGSSCFTSGTIDDSANSLVFGDEFLIWVSMNDGSTLQLSGTFADPGETSLEPVAVLVQNGQCAKSFASGTLTLQQ